MFIRSMLVCAVLGLGAFGCASEEPEAGGSGVVADDDGTASNDITSNARQAQLNGLRLRLQQDFANAPSLRGYKLVFKVHTLESNATRAFIMARILKRDAAGKDSELTEQNLKESVYAEHIADGAFDGPEVIAALGKKGNAWSVMKKGEYEAYVVGPTDVPFESWDTNYGIPRSWLGFD